MKRPTMMIRCELVKPNECMWSCVVTNLRLKGEHAACVIPLGGGVEEARKRAAKVFSALFAQQPPSEWLNPSTGRWERIRVHG